MSTAIETRCLKYIEDESIAFTLEGGQIIQWEPEPGGPSRVFEMGGRKKLLYSDKGWWWHHQKKEAENCFYAEAWFGEFPYSSYGYGFRLCKTTGAVHVERFETEINPSGLTAQDLFRRDCKTYIP